MHRARGTGLNPWPHRLTSAPPRLEEIGISPEEFLEDTVSKISSDLFVVQFHGISFFLLLYLKCLRDPFGTEHMALSST